MLNSHVKSKKSLFVTMLAIIMLLALTVACSKKEAAPASSVSPASSPASTPSQTQAAAESATPAPLEPYEFTAYFNYDWYDASAKWGDDKVSQFYNEKFNIKMKKAKPEGDPIQKLNVMIASDDLPDVIQMERDANYLKLIQLGKLIPLDEFINNNSSYKRIIDDKTIELSKVNGKVYGMLNYATTTDHPTGNGGWAINKNIYEQLGSPKLQTTDDLLHYLKLVKDSNLKVDGKTVVPIQFAESGMIDLMMGSFGLNPLNAVEGVVPIQNELKLYFNEPRAIDALLYLNKLWNNGLINKDYFVEKSEQIQEKLTTGRVAVYAGNNITSDLKDYRNTLKDHDPTNDYIVIEPPAAPGVDQSKVYNSTYSTLGWNVVGISNKAKNPERIFQLLDSIVSEDGSRLNVYGPEGGLYDELDSEGYPILKSNLSSLSSEERKALGIGVWGILGNTKYADFSKAANDNRKPVEERDWATQAQINIIWKHSMNTDAYIGTTPEPQSPEGIAAASFSDLNLKALPKIVMAKDESQSRAAIAEALDNAYKLGFEKVEKFKTEIYQQNMKLLGQ